MQIACLLPAAGASSRMRGGDKLLEDVNGKPCLATLAGRALDAGMEVIVTLPSADHPRAEAIKDLCVQKVIVPNAGKTYLRSMNRNYVKKNKSLQLSFNA